MEFSGRLFWKVLAFRRQLQFSGRGHREAACCWNQPDTAVVMAKALGGEREGQGEEGGARTADPARSPTGPSGSREGALGRGQGWGCVAAQEGPAA